MQAITVGAKRMLLWHKPAKPNEWFHLELLWRSDPADAWDRKVIGIAPDELARIVNALGDAP